MVYKLFIEDGDYLNSQSQICNLVGATSVNTPEGVNVGWTEYATLELAITGFGLTLRKPSTEVTNLVNRVNAIENVLLEVI